MIIIKFELKFLTFLLYLNSSFARWIPVVILDTLYKSEGVIYINKFLKLYNLNKP